MSRQHLSWWHLSISGISQLLLTQFWWNFKGRFLGTFRTDSNCQGYKYQGKICPHDICPYQEYLSCFWPDFDQTLKLPFWDILWQMSTVIVTFVLVTFVHINFNQIWIKYFLRPKFIWTSKKCPNLFCLDQSFSAISFVWTQNLSGPKTIWTSKLFLTRNFLNPYFFWLEFILTKHFLGPECYGTKLFWTKPNYFLINNSFGSKTFFNLIFLTVFFYQNFVWTINLYGPTYFVTTNDSLEPQGVLTYILSILALQGVSKLLYTCFL